MMQSLFFQNSTPVNIKDVLNKNIEVVGCCFQESIKGEYVVMYVVGVPPYVEAVSFQTSSKCIIKIMKAYVSGISQFQLNKIYNFESPLSGKITEKIGKLNQKYYLME